MEQWGMSHYMKWRLYTQWSCELICVVDCSVLDFYFTIMYYMLKERIIDNIDVEEFREHECGKKSLSFIGSKRVRVRK